MKKLKIGDKVVASFLGASQNCIVIEVIEKDRYKLKTNRGTILPDCTWKKKATKDRKGNITSPWYIIKTNEND